ncbi:unnamed protein product [Vitrella brassicaformis CCMP3155]|uniref:FMN hydroxy acid dehydrogenase domain-containing protein n=2 Tax=Vitrella brassicaformis TaxID=1169539 RepID=A0A0G4GYL0_VITBC|nr:unnamed protein product [Vitrella brassicaformis CCMP3155]|eukprot:CEM36117.1 unnamed protein product [Vitrella brassicaformis CCMP3155]
MSMSRSKASAEESVPVNLDDFERIADKRLTKAVHGYYSSGANDEVSLRENRVAFERIRLRPRFLIDVDNIQLQTSILGYNVSMPLIVSPTAMQKMAHPDGETGVAIACKEMGIPMTLSTLATTSVTDVSANCGGEGLRFFQLYTFRDRGITYDLVKRAEAAGFKALVLTVDTPTLGRRNADIRNQFSLPTGLSLANFEAPKAKSTLGSEGTNLSDAREAVRIAAKQGMADHSDSRSALSAYTTKFFDASLTWDSIKWLKSITNLPIVVKGVMTAEDAILAKEQGVAAVWVSNHGARQLDGVDATIDVLEEVVDALRGTSIEVYLDGGIRRGTDILKALALGARAVAFGRPALWGLTYNGKEGVSQVLQMMKDELSLAMKLSGATNVSSVPRDLIRMPYDAPYKSKL